MSSKLLVTVVPSIRLAASIHSNRAYRALQRARKETRKQIKTHARALLSTYTSEQASTSDYFAAVRLAGAAHASKSLLLLIRSFG